MTQRIDAIQAGLADVGLPAYTARLYQRPLIITPELCPMLAIFPKTLEPTLLSTESDYENIDDLIVLWAENAADSLELGVYEASRARASIGHAELVISTLQEWGVGIPGVSEQNDLTVRKAQWGLLEGGIWACEIQAGSTTWG